MKYTVVLACPKCKSTNFALLDDSRDTTWYKCEKCGLEGEILNEYFGRYRDRGMKKMIIYGSSDDCRIIGGDFHEEEYCDVAKITDSDGDGIYVIWSYSEKVRNGCWCIGFQQLDEDVPIPDWARCIKVTMAERGYSVEYELDVPNDVTVEWMVDE